MGAVKGNDTGLRGEIGNLSAPWLLVAFLPALRFATLRRGAVVGLVSTLSALVGFYGVLTVVLAGQLGGGGFLPEFLVESRANRIYFLAGMATGPLCGAVGAWLGARHPDTVLIVVGVVLAGEILVVALLSGHQLAPAPLYFAWGVADWRAYIAESILGLAVVLSALIRRPQRAGGFAN